jgi:CubicO group peptidase (beta-lactamase class C family)
MMSRQKSLNFAPGAQHLYSNSGYALLAIIVKRATTSSLKEFAAKEVLAPLGMTTSRFRDDHTEPIPNRAIGYAPRNGGFRQNVPTFDVVGDGGLFSSARELAMWDPTDLQLISAPGTLNNGTSVPYAMGLRIDTYRGLPILRHGGAYGGYQTDVTRFPGNRMGVTVLCNQSDARAWQWGQGGLAQKVADVFFADRFTTPVPSNGVPGGVAGSWLGSIPVGEPRERAVLFSEELDTSWTIAVWDNYLRLTRRNQAAVEFNRVEHSNDFRSPTMTIHLTRDAGGKISGMTADAGEIKGIRFVALSAR